ncbi:uncharacterized protein LOC119669343 [Teleopsis dalmanni]|uniref:uncharacterized protein LOC119669343 n=1 Tax=Teleopsis dalmanni TaxID=139649 RepID=UPI0018CD6C54|nr:uncharacterized protein LOC119669343 [Teleopsis dalmanni]
MELLKDHLTKHREKAGVQPAKLTRLQEIDKKIAEIGQKQSRVEECTDPKICRLVENASPDHRKLRTHYTEDLAEFRKQQKEIDRSSSRQERQDEREEKTLKVTDLYSSDVNMNSKRKLSLTAAADHERYIINAHRSNAGYDVSKDKTSAKAMFASAKSDQSINPPKRSDKMDIDAFFNEDNDAQGFLPGRPLNKKKCFVRDPKCVKDLLAMDSEDEEKDDESDSDASDTVEELLKTAQIIARSHKTTRNLFDRCITCTESIDDLDANYLKEVIEKKTRTGYRLMRDNAISLSNVANRLKQKRDELLPPKLPKKINAENVDNTVIWNRYSDKSRD